MLRLYQSNDMQTLADAFCTRSSNFDDPFEPLTVLTQSFGIGQWLKIQLAQHHGISANVDCVLPATFLWRLYQHLIPATRQLSESPYDLDRLLWRVMRLIQQNPGLSGAVNNYLGGSGDRDLRLYQLAREITLLFDEYLMYRPDWILNWSENPTGNQEDEPGHMAWQAELWRLILADLPEHRDLHRAALHRQVLQLLSSDPGQLPWRRLAVFGLSTMPPLQLQTFEALAGQIEVDVYFLNPCQYYWGDIVSPKDKVRRSVRALLDAEHSLTDEDYLEVGNPLLSSLGKQGREYLELLLESDQVQPQPEAFEEADIGTMLGFVKNDILEMTLGGQWTDAMADEPIEKQPLQDTSIQVHACHSRLREVEVLHDAILTALDSSGDLKPSDIIVMVPNIADYAPFVRSVFTDSLPFRISDRSSLETSSLLTGFLWLMQLPQSRVTGSDVMDLLEIPAVMRRFELSQEDLDTLAWWIDESGIRWEISGEHKTQYWGVPGEHQNTWRFGLERLLLGYAMSDTQGLWNGIAPVEISPSEAELLGTLCHLMDQLTRYRELLSVEKTMAEWQLLATGLLEDFFVARDDEILESNLLLQQLDAITDNALAADYREPVSYQLLVNALTEAVTSKPASAGFISGGITFATLVPMRSIPFRMVCLLGMNDGEYPRDERPHSFDLIASGQPRRGDRSKKLDDRYLFLEALLSARERFHVSFIGRGARDNKERPPSGVLNEFINYLNTVFTGFTLIEHALQPFNPRYFEGGGQQSYDRHWYTALTNSDPAPEFAGNGLARDTAFDCTSVTQLNQFLRHTGRYFLQQRLGVYLGSDEADLKDTEPFQLDNLEQFQLADEALSLLVDGQDLDAFRERQLHTGHLLTGDLGQQQLARGIERAHQIHDAVMPYLATGATRINTEVQVSERSLLLQLDNIYDDHLISYRAGRLGARHQLEAWVQHLAINTLDDYTTVCIFRDKNGAGTLQIAPIERELAVAHLGTLLDYYDEGLQRPLFLPPEACKTYADAIQGRSAESAMTRTIDNWNRDLPGAEHEDRHWQRLFSVPEGFRGRFQADAINIWQPILEACGND